MASLKQINHLKKYWFKNGHQINKGRIGEANGYWRGHRVSYAGLHAWVKKELGRPDTCEHCGKSDFKQNEIDWANKSGNYKREISDWIRLCKKCHKKYDGINILNWKPKLTLLIEEELDTFFIEGGNAECNTINKIIKFVEKLLKSIST